MNVLLTKILAQANFVEILTNVKNFIWDNILLFALFGVGIFLSVVLGFPQVKHTIPTLKKMLQDIISKKPAKPGSMTPFQSLTTAIAAQVGTGNVVGVATAVASGGPGAAFWMLLSAFFGMSSIFSEAVMAQVYNDEKQGEKVGGPAYYISKGLGSKFLATAFAILCIIGLGVVGIMVQSNSIVASMHAAFGIPDTWLTVTLLVVVGVILAGGMDRIASFSENVVPVMAFVYIFGSLIIVFINVDMLWPAIKSIFIGAFTPEAIGGGALGISIQEAARFGIARGLFSNEAGMGSTPHSHAVAETDHPAEQGCIAMIGVFISTFFICLCTVLVNLGSGSYNPSLPATEMIKSADIMTQGAFGLGFGNFGTIFLAIALSCFALTTIVGWYFFAESNVKYLAGNKRLVISVFRVLSLGFLVVGTFFTGETVWTLADLFMGLMALPNIIALFIMWKRIRYILRDYEEGLKTGEISWSKEKFEEMSKLHFGKK